jgi:hypothetical protein
VTASSAVAAQSIIDDMQLTSVSSISVAIDLAVGLPDCDLPTTTLHTIAA